MKTKNVPARDFGKDHWSLLAYLECRCVDNGGTLDLRHLRCNSKRHPLHNVNGTKWDPKWGTRLKGYWSQDGKTDSKLQLKSHDDWDVLADLAAAGYVTELPGERVALTPTGMDMAAELRAHKASGGQFATFSPFTAAMG